MNPVEEFLTFDQGNPGLVKTAQQPMSWAARNPMAATTIAAVATPMALMAAHEGYQEIKGMVGRARGFKRMMDYNPKLKKLPAAKTKAMFNTLHNAAPDLAKDPVVASSWVNRMSLQDEYVDPRTLSDLGAAQKNVARKGLELPVGHITAGMMSATSDPVHKQLDRAQRSTESASNLAFNQTKFDYQKTRDVADDIRSAAAEKRYESAEGRAQSGEARQRIEHAMRRSAARRDRKPGIRGGQLSGIR